MTVAVACWSVAVNLFAMVRQRSIGDCSSPSGDRSDAKQGQTRFNDLGERLGVAIISTVDDKSRKLVAEACEALVGVRQPVIARG